jgi:D-alanyl-D-alanine carboxypeptidase
LVSGKPFDFAPGTQFLYNNTGYYLLGMLLEQVAGSPYQELISKQLCGPLGLGIRYDSNTEIIPHRAQGYAAGRSGLENDKQFGVSQPGAAGALLSTAADLVRWAHLLQAGKVVSSKSYEAMCTPTKLSDDSQRPYGYGLSIDDLGGERRVGHGGGIFGFNSILNTYPDAGLVVCVLSNSEAASAARLEQSISQSLLAVLARE